jgi:hypothetical protein
MRGINMLTKLIAWWSRFKTTTEAGAPVSLTGVAGSVPNGEPDNFVKVIDYPSNKYKVYWETLVHDYAKNDWIAEIRFYGYADNSDFAKNIVLRSISKELLYKKIHDTVVMEMKKHKREA